MVPSPPVSAVCDSKRFQHYYIDDSIVQRITPSLFVGVGGAVEQICYVSWWSRLAERLPITNLGGIKAPSSPLVA